jgi:hypothetical protein
MLSVINVAGESHLRSMTSALGAPPRTGGPRPPGYAWGSRSPPVCGLGKTGDCTTQFYAKAHPTIREIELVALLGNHGVLSSLRPIHPSEMARADALFGYRLAVNGLITRMRGMLDA